MRTLIVEDDSVSRMMLQDMLEEYSEVTCVANGAEALKIFLSEKFDLICLDLNMPQLDGHEVLAYIRAYENATGLKLGKGSKVLITSIMKNPLHVFRAFRGTADGYLAKPFELEQLISYLRDFNLIEK